jgi:hypothetical protein
VICTGDIMNNNHSYQQVDFANGGDIRGMIRAWSERAKPKPRSWPQTR